MGVCNSTLRKKSKKTIASDQNEHNRITVPITDGMKVIKNPEISTDQAIPQHDSLVQYQTTNEGIAKNKESVIIDNNPEEPNKVDNEDIQQEKEILLELSVPPYHLNHKRILGSPIRAKKAPTSPLNSPIDLKDISGFSLNSIEIISEERTVGEQNNIKKFICHSNTDEKFKRSLINLPDPTQFMNTSSDLFYMIHRIVPSNFGVYTYRLKRKFHNWNDDEYDCIRAIKYPSSIRKICGKKNLSRKELKYAKFCPELDLSTQENRTLNITYKEFLRIKRQIMPISNGLKMIKCSLSFDVFAESLYNRSPFIKTLPKTISTLELCNPINSALDLFYLNKLCQSYPHLKKVDIKFGTFSQKILDDMEKILINMKKVELGITFIDKNELWEELNIPGNRIIKNDILGKAKHLAIKRRTLDENDGLFIVDKLKLFRNIEKLLFDDTYLGSNPVIYDFSLLNDLRKLEELCLNFSPKSLIAFNETCKIPESLRTLKIYCQDVNSTEDMTKIIQGKKLYKSLNKLIHLKKFSFEIMTLLSLEIGTTVDSFMLFTSIVENLSETVTSLSLAHSVHLNYQAFPNTNLLPLISDKFKRLTSLTLNFQGMKVSDESLDKCFTVFPKLEELKVFNIDSHFNIIDKMIHSQNLKTLEVHLSNKTTNSQLASYLKLVSKLKSLKVLYLYAYHISDPLNIVMMSLIRLLKDCTELAEFVLDWGEPRSELREEWLKRLIQSKESLRFCIVSFSNGWKIIKTGKRIKCLNVV